MRNIYQIMEYRDYSALNENYLLLRQKSPTLQKKKKEKKESHVLEADITIKQKLIWYFQLKGFLQVPNGRHFACLTNKSITY